MDKPDIITLERLLKCQQFSILDASAICNNTSDKLAYSTKITNIEPADLSVHVDWYASIPKVLQETISFATRQVIQEFSEGIKNLRKINTRIIRTTPTKDYTFETQINQLQQLQNCAEEAEQALKKRQLFFKQDTIYQILFSFFKKTLNWIKPEQKIQKEQSKFEKTNKRHRGDESVCAAALYFTFTGENNVDAGDKNTTAVITQDTDILNGVKTGLFLFQQASQTEFGKMMQASPTKVYFPGFNDRTVYVPRLNSKEQKTLGTAEYVSNLFKGKINDARELAKQIFEEIKDYLPN